MTRLQVVSNNESAHGTRLLSQSGGGGMYDGMEARVAKLEVDIEYIKRDVSELKVDIRGLHQIHDRDFRITFAALIGVALGLAALLAKGFHWI